MVKVVKVSEKTYSKLVKRKSEMEGERRILMSFDKVIQDLLKKSGT